MIIIIKRHVVVHAWHVLFYHFRFQSNLYMLKWISKFIRGKNEVSHEVIIVNDLIFNLTDWIGQFISVIRTIIDVFSFSVLKWLLVKRSFTRHLTLYTTINCSIRKGRCFCVMSLLQGAKRKLISVFDYQSLREEVRSDPMMSWSL